MLRVESPRGKRHSKARRHHPESEREEKVPRAENEGLS